MVKDIASISFSGKMVAVVGASVGGRKNVPAKENKERCWSCDTLCSL